MRTMSTQQQEATDGQMDQRPDPPQQLNRSCESCRSLKVRCLPDANVTNQCQRCAKAKRACIFVAPQRRRPRKRTDSRVAQLEKEMAAMRTALKGRRLVTEETLNEDSETGKEEDEADFGSEATGKPQPTNYQDIQFTSPIGPFNRPFLHDTSSQSPSHGSSSQISGDGNSSLTTPALSMNSNFHDKGSEGDVIDRGVISMNTAEDLVSLFITDLLVYFPFMVFPTNTTARQLRHAKPVLFLAIITASSIAVDDGLANTLNREMLALYAQRFFLRGEKSLEMVQTLLLMNIYYLPPESPSQIQAYQYSHIAATMALEIGIASKKRIPRRSNQNQRQDKPVDKFDEQMAEQARTILTCYHLASNVAMRTRRPNMLPFNDWIKECVRLLSRSPIDSDQWFASWFGLQIITDEALSSFGLDDTSSTAVLTETRVNSVLRLFDKKIEDWKEDMEPEHLTVPMILEYQYTTLVVYELGIGEGYREPDAIKRQYYTLPAPDGDGFLKRPTEPLSAMRVDLTIKWLHAAQGLLNTFLSCDVHTMRKMPNLTYMRTVLGLMVLLKIFFSIKSGALGEVIRYDTVKVEWYLESLTHRLTEASAGCKYPIPSRWLRVVGGKAQDWFQRFQKHQRDQESQRQDEYTASGNTQAAVAPSISTLSDAWHGGIVPTPTPTAPPGANVSFSREFILQHHQQQQQQEKAEYQHQSPQFNPGLGYPGLSAVQGTTTTTNAAKSTTVTTTAATSAFSDYNQATAWIRPPPPSSSSPIDPNMQQQVDPHAGGGYHLSPQDVWTLQQQQQQQLVNLHNHQSFPSAMSGSDHDIFPMDMEFDWVPEHGIFQLPTF